VVLFRGVSARLSIPPQAYDQHKVSYLKKVIKPKTLVFQAGHADAARRLCGIWDFSTIKFVDQHNDSPTSYKEYNRSVQDMPMLPQNRDQQQQPPLISYSRLQDRKKWDHGDIRVIVEGQLYRHTEPMARMRIRDTIRMTGPSTKIMLHKELHQLFVSYQEERCLSLLTEAPKGTQ
jgi:hypothetical protein